MTHDPPLLRALVEAVGAERVLLGSDYPFDMGDPDPVATSAPPGSRARGRAGAVRGNAERVLGLDPVAVRE